MRKSILALMTCLVLLSCSASPRKSPPVNSPPPSTSDSRLKGTSQEIPGEGPVPPENVRSEQVRILNGVKILTVGNAQGHYRLSCNTNLESCITPTPGKNYLLFTETTRWKFPGAKEFATLKFLQDFSGSYNDAENIALIPEQERAPIGMYQLQSWEKNN